jgi:tetratricopeptide (TPR) repeat protein
MGRGGPIAGSWRGQVEWEKRVMRPILPVSMVLALFLASPMAHGPALAIENQNELIERARNPDRAEAARLIEAGQYLRAIPLLRNAAAKDPGNADIHNSLGFAYRKSKQFDAAMRHYKAALRIEPDHRGANEYLGELYLELGRLAEAEERLKVLAGACRFQCEERQELEKAIAKYKARGGKEN